MTLSTTTNRVSYTGNGTTTAFAVAFKFQADADLTVVLRDNSTLVETTQTITTHYTVSGAGDDAGGTVTMVTPPTSGEDLIIYRDPAQTQLVDLVENDPQPAETLEDALDLLTMMVQRLAERADRSVALTEGNTAVFDPTLPLDVVTADAFIKVKTDLSGFELAELGTLGAFSFPAGNGILTKTSSLNSVARTITGTSDQISMTNGDGVAGNPVVAIASDPIIPGTAKIRPPVGTSAQRPGTPVDGDLRYNSDDNQFEGYKDGAWTGGFIPTGVVLPYAATGTPAGFLACDGAAVSRTTYATLFALIGITHGQGDGSTTFNVPDYRGYFLRGVDGAAGNDPDAGARTAMATGGNTGDNVGSIQAAATAQPTTAFTTNTTGSHTHNYDYVTNTSTVSGPRTVIRDDGVSGSAGNMIASAGNHSHSITGGGDNETRPINAYVHYIIKV